MSKLEKRIEAHQIFIGKLKEANKFEGNLLKQKKLVKEQINNYVKRDTALVNYITNYLSSEDELLDKTIELLTHQNCLIVEYGKYCHNFIQQN